MQLSTANLVEKRNDDRRRPDWQQNDRRQTWPWVADSNDRRTGEDRRLKERRTRPAHPNGGFKPQPTAQ